MKEIRLHGLGGEGIVRMSEIIGEAAVADGKWAHSFPFFGTEIRGAAVKAFTRVDDKPITLRSNIYEPDIVMLTNDTLLENPDVTSGLKKDTTFLLNTAQSKDAIESKFLCTAYVINAIPLAYDIIGRPIVNTIMLGAFIGITGIIALPTAESIIRKGFNASIAEKNITALNKGYELVREA